MVSMWSHSQGAALFLSCSQDLPGDILALWLINIHRCTNAFPEVLSENADVQNSLMPRLVSIIIMLW